MSKGDVGERNPVKEAVFFVDQETVNPRLIGFLPQGRIIPKRIIVGPQEHS
jgi:hypothetical protein